MFSFSGGCGRMTSSCVTRTAPWRKAVPTQSDAGVAAADHDDMHATGGDRLLRPSDGLDVLAADALVLLHQVGHRVVHAVQLVAGNAGRARRLGAAAIEYGIIARRAGSATGLSTPTSTPVRKLTPSASIWRTRAVDECFSILKSGMP